MTEEQVKKSHELFEAAKKLIPGGVQKARHPKNFTDQYPIFMDRGEGAHVWDVDGNKYIDWLLSYGPLVLGHCDKRVNDAVIAEMGKGFVFNLTSPLQLELCKKLTEIIPSAEKVQIVMCGSEANTAAVRIARIHTGREKIIRWGYHGWHDWCISNHAGVPKTTYEAVMTFEYNNLDSLQEVLEKNKNEVACIIMMPFEFTMPAPSFLKGVRELADRYGVVFILDEIRSWPRMGLGGAQEYFGVTPDITVISKGIANGYPISAVVGKAEIMEAGAKTTISATYFPSTLGIAAALATLEELEEKNGIAYIWKIAKQIVDGLNQIIESKKVNAAVIGAPQMPFLFFGDDSKFKKHWKNQIYDGGDPGSEKDKAMMKAFYNETIKRGIFFHPRHHWYSCLSHTEEDVKKTLQASEEAMDIALKSV